MVGYEELFTHLSESIISKINLTTTSALRWIKHFDMHTKPDDSAAYRLLLVDADESLGSWEFIYYCLENNITTVVLPPNVTHLMQSLNVEVLTTLQHYYGKEINSLCSTELSNVSKDQFVKIYFLARERSFTYVNILSAFRATGLCPFNPDRVPRTPSSPPTNVVVDPIGSALLNPQPSDP